MNITLSADEELIRKARDYAAQRGTSLNQIIREYMEQLTRVADAGRNADEFERLARERGGAGAARARRRLLRADGGRHQGDQELPLPPHADGIKIS